MPPAIVELILSNSGSRSLCTLASSVHKGSLALPSSPELVSELGLILGEENEHLVPCHASQQDDGRMPPEKSFYSIPPHKCLKTTELAFRQNSRGSLYT